VRPAGLAGQLVWWAAAIKNPATVGKATAPGTAERKVSPSLLLQQLF
jgi:hypothetical protein